MHSYHSFLSLSLSVIVCAWHPSANLLHPGPSSFWGIIFFRLYSTSCQAPWWEGPSGLLEELLQTWHSFRTPRYLIDFSDTDLPTVIHRQGWESLREIPVSCSSMIIQEFYSNIHGFNYSIPRFITSVRGIHIVVTSKLISDVLHVLRVSHLDYPGCPHMRIVSKNEFLSLFCETPSSWGDHQNTSCSSFAKGLRFLNMVMTFVLHPLSHYNSITEPRAQFLLSLLEGLTIDFSSHFILFLIDVYKDTATRDKLIFPSTFMWILHHVSISLLLCYVCH